LYISVYVFILLYLFFFFQAEDGIRDRNVTGVQTCALPILDTVQVFLEQMSHLYSGVESEVNFRSDYSLSPFCLLKYFCPSLLSFINFPSYSRTCPVPCTINLVEVKA